MILVTCIVRPLVFSLILLSLWGADANALTSGRRPPATASMMPDPWKMTFVRQVYVSTVGADANAGTIGSPVRTISEAVRRAKSYGSGTEIIVRSGTYNGSDIIVDFDGTGSRWNALRGYPGERPRIFGTRSWQLVHLRGSYFLFEGFEVSGSKVGTETSNGITLSSRSDVINWSKRQLSCWSGEVCGSGVYIEARAGGVVHHVVIRDNLVHDFPGGGISSNGADYLLIERNFSHHNAYGSFYGHSGISIWHSKSFGPLPADTARILVRGNVSYANHQYVPSTAIGINRPTDGNGIIFDQNTALNYPHRMRAENNIVFDNGGSGIHVYDSNDVGIVNNTSYGNSMGRDQNDGEIYANTSENVWIMNNIMYASPGKRINSNWANHGLLMESNILFGTVAADLLGPTDIVVDPLFLKASRSFVNLDFMPQANSAAVDGASGLIAAGNDYFGKSPARGRDIGAIERR